ncbi:MAG: hypothetical protein ACKOJF_27290 [Planctomycetaceae bacterium]
MSAAETLNTALIGLHRSLLQYAGECWPWAAAGDAASEARVRGLAARERELVGQLFTLLNDRGVAVDFGTYPDHSALHYVSLPFLLERMESESDRFAEQLKALAPTVAGDEEGWALFGQVQSTVAANLEAIRELRAKAQSPVAVG